MPVNGGGSIVFVTGGARSGKSGFSLDRAETLSGDRAFIATAEATDEEMADRIKRHKDDRDKSWSTIEEPLELAEALKRAASIHDVIVIDCLTLWLSNILMAHRDISVEVRSLISGLQAVRNKAHVFIVSNEVGMGIVPVHELARRFRDEAGRLNREVAAIADEVYLMVAGIPLTIKNRGGV